MVMDKHTESFDSTTSSNATNEWETKMADAPEFNNVKDGDKRERAKVTPIHDLSSEERRRILEGGGKIVARLYGEDSNDAPHARTINASELTADASKIGTSIREAQDAAKAPKNEAEALKKEVQGMNGTQKELMQAKVEAMKQEMEAIEKALGDEGKSPEQIKEARKKKIGHAAWKVFEIVGGAIAGAGASAALTAMASML